MKLLNYILQGFGFQHSSDYLRSTFGFAYSPCLLKWDAIIAFILSSVPVVFGFNHIFFYAFVLLGCVEWWTGIRASFKRNEKHESRKMGRMFLKMATYAVLLHILNLMNKNIAFPEILGFELDPFGWMYWVTLVAIIWQLIVSVLENLDTLGYEFAKILLRIINKKFYKQFDLEQDEKDSPTNI